MRIAVVSHVRHPIAEPFKGGMEAHSWHLANALVERGHDVTLFASGDSDPRFRIHPTMAEHYDAVYPWHDFHGTDALNYHMDRSFGGVCRALSSGRYDVVHNNSLHRYPPRLARTRRIPMVTSLHIPPFDALHRAVQESAAPWSKFTVTSHAQVQCWWPEGLPGEASVVFNGIDLARWPFRPEGDGSAVWSGRITPNKGTHLAVRAAREAGLRLRLFGMIEDQGYFDAEVRPLLGGQASYDGHIPGRELAEELGRASVLLFTPLWDEPFGLAAIEAMACGLPIAAFRSGAAEEIIGEAGRFADPGDAAALAHAALACLDMPRDVPRNRVRTEFAIETMVERYEDLYRRVIAARDAEFPSVEFPRIELDVA